MFSPNFHYTDKIVRNLTLIAEARAIILNASLVPKWEVTLRRDALLQSAHSSTAIEGNQLSLEEVTDLAAGRDIMVRRRDRQEVLNYLEALEKIPDFSKKVPFTSEDFLKVHKTVTKETLDDPRDEGAFRSRQVGVVNRATSEVIFMPPPTAEVPGLTSAFLDWLNSPGVEELEPVIQAGITHYEIVRIHPFIDGNGRTARVIATLVLYKRGFDVKRFFALDDYYDQDRPAYYGALRRIDPNTIDLTDWLEYFSNGVAVSIEAVKQKVIGISKDIKFVKEKGQIALTKRQMKIIEKIIESGKITNKDIREMFSISDEASLKEISKLLDLEIIKGKGKGRSFHYVLK